MSDEKKYTEREVVRRERTAYLKGKCSEGTYMSFMSGCWAAFHYPMPKVTRPRVVTFDGCRYRVVDGVVQWQANQYAAWCSSTITAEKARALADLLANPTEEVPDDRDD